MINDIENFETQQRERLIEVANEKWSIKTKLKKFKESISQMKNELDEEKIELKDEESKLRDDLNKLNHEITGLDLFCRSSHRLQAEAAKTVAKSPTNAVALQAMQKKYAPCGDQPFKSFYDVSMACFPKVDQKVNTMEQDASTEDYSLIDIFKFYQAYYSIVYLPRKDVLDKLKADRFWIWKQLVRVVTKKNSCSSHIDELQVILQHIDAALDSKFQPDFVDNLPEDTPETYNKEWSDVLSLMQDLLTLRKEQATIQDELNKVLHNREFLRDWSSEVRAPSISLGKSPSLDLRPASLSDPRLSKS
eukprot:TRINITY_DN2104_c2_g1_i1.p1 TRINITY_DN2104_c2_g1~~TRINITY_DN2104_c2_g1_i1.p1  ORF type:complete len:305 (-),score=85.89 TRINITY_DN2104_c2_g1_i1:21-935(-)